MLLLDSYVYNELILNYSVERSLLQAIAHSQKTKEY